MVISIITTPSILNIRNC